MDGGHCANGGVPRFLRDVDLAQWEWRRGGPHVPKRGRAICGFSATADYDCLLVKIAAGSREDIFLRLAVASAKSPDEMESRLRTE